LSKSLALPVNQKRLHIETSGVVPSIGRQAALLGIARASVYYQSRAKEGDAVFIKNKIDEIYTKRPYYGVRRITWQLHKDGYQVNHKKVHVLMQEMGIQALYPKPHLSKGNPDHKIYPYLLRGVTAGYSNHIWGTDITYIRMKHGFMYLVAYLDWFSRYIVSWRLATSLEIAFVLEAAEEALENYGAPEITNSDQGSHFTSEQHTRLFLEKETRISMDGRGRAMDNIFTERLWRTIKYEEVYLKDYASVMEAKQNIGEYITFYNNERPHQSLGNTTPKEIYETNKR